MPSRPKKPPATEWIPGGSYTAKESSRVVRAQLEASMKYREDSWVTIPVADEGIDSLTVCVTIVTRTTAVCTTRDNRHVIIILGERNEADKLPELLLD